MVSQDDEIDEIDDQLSEDDGKLVPADQFSTHVSRCHFADIHRANSRSKSYAYAAQYSICVEGSEQWSRGVSLFEEKKLGVERTQCGQEKEAACDE